MANDLNRHECIGRLGQDPEIKYTQGGSAVANITVACSSSWKDKNSGQKQEKTEWIRYVAFGKLAEIIGEYLKKGSKVYLSGELRTREWTDNENVKRYTTEIVANEMQMLDSRQEADTNQQARAAAGSNNPAQRAHAQQQKLDQLTRTYTKEEIASALAVAASQPAGFDDFDDSDIPF